MNQSYPKSLDLKIRINRMKIKITLHPQNIYSKYHHQWSNINSFHGYILFFQDCFPKISLNKNPRVINIPRERNSKERIHFPPRTFAAGHRGFTAIWTCNPREELRTILSISPQTVQKNLLDPSGIPRPVPRIRHVTPRVFGIFMPVRRMEQLCSCPIHAIQRP